MYRMYITMTAVFMFFSLHVWGVSLEECRKMARENYPQIKMFGILEATRDYNLSVAAKAWLPQIVVGANGSWQNRVAEYPEVLKEMLTSKGVDMQGLRKDQYRVFVDLQQTIWDGGKTGAKRNTIRRQSEEDAMESEVEMYALEERVDEVFFSILLLEKQGETLRQTMGNVESNLKTLKAMLVNGTAMQADVDAVEAELISLRQQLANAESAESSFRQVLGLYCNERIDRIEGTFGSPPQVTIPLKGVPNAGAKEGGEGIMKGRPELGYFSARLNTLDARQREVKRELMPTLSAYGSAYYGYPGLDFMAAMIDHKWNFNLQVGVRLSWNVSSLFSRRAKLNVLQSGKDQVEMMREVFVFNNRLAEVRDQNEITRLKKVIESDAQIVRLRGNVRRAEESKLREGIINTSQLLDKITAERNALIMAKTHEIELMKAYVKLNHTLGK
ncbi:MAG: TolC family protein [Bacteroidaceae bacterium]|nr:TolC family protein [Bacteroidaceae bacterium]